MDCRFWKACAICGGTGTLSDSEEEMDCPNCNGTGCDHYDTGYSENCNGFCPERIHEAATPTNKPSLGGLIGLYKTGQLDPSGYKPLIDGLLAERAKVPKGD